VVVGAAPPYEKAPGARPEERHTGDSSRCYTAKARCEASQWHDGNTPESLASRLGVLPGRMGEGPLIASRQNTGPFRKPITEIAGMNRRFEPPSRTDKLKRNGGHTISAAFRPLQFPF